MQRIFGAVALLAMAWFGLAAFSAGAGDVKAAKAPSYSDYRLADPRRTFHGEHRLALVRPDLDAVVRALGASRERETEQIVAQDSNSKWMLTNRGGS